MCDEVFLTLEYGQFSLNKNESMSTIDIRIT